jgi:pentatricopeptide repeat protein
MAQPLRSLLALAFEQRGTKDATPVTVPWLGYSYFHLGEYKKALEVYHELLKKSEPDPVNWLYSACCHFYMGQVRPDLPCLTARTHVDIVCGVAVQGG